MACVSSVNFYVFVNGHLSCFLKGSRGLIQGFPLSTYMFLLVIEGLSRLIEVVKEEGKFTGIKETLQQDVTHILFVDDVIFGGFGSIQEWKYYNKINNIFIEAYGMEVSSKKSVLFFNNIVKF